MNLKKVYRLYRAEELVVTVESRLERLAYVPHRLFIRTGSVPVAFITDAMSCPSPPFSQYSLQSLAGRNGRPTEMADDAR